MFLGGSLCRNNKSARKRTNFLPHRGFYVPQVSINCLACCEGVKYKQISNEKAVPRLNCPITSLQYLKNDGSVLEQDFITNSLDGLVEKYFLFLTPQGIFLEEKEKK